MKIHLAYVYTHAGPGRYFKYLSYVGKYSQWMWINNIGYWSWK